MANSLGNTQRSAPILVVHLDRTMRRVLKQLLAFDGYVAHETGRGAVALHTLQAAEDGMIVYLEPLFLQFPGSERLRDYVLDRGQHNPHVLILLAVIGNIEAAMAPLRADGYLALPFTLPQVLNSVEVALRVLQAKQALHVGQQKRPIQRSRATAEARAPRSGGRRVGGRRVTDESRTGMSESERSDQNDKQTAMNEKARQITIEVWQKAARDFARYAVQARRQGKQRLAAAWEQARQRARARWQAAKRGEPEPAWVHE